MATEGRAGGKKTGGRKKGVPNKITSDLRALVLGALDKAGGERYLVEQATENPQSFMALLGRCIPKEVKAELEGGITFRVVTGVPDAGS